MGTFRHHPDGLIVIDDTLIDLAEFQTEEPGYALPAGVAGLVYESGRSLYAYDDEGNQTASPIKAGTLDGYIAKLATYEANIAARTAPPEPTLDEVRAAALASVDAEAEACRHQWMTPGDGQALSYREKSDEAADCLASYDAQNPPPAGTFLLLESEVGITGADVLAVAAVVDAKHAAWRVVEAGINTIRLGAKRDIEAAADAAAVQAILDGLSWPSP